MPWRARALATAALAGTLFAAGCVSDGPASPPTGAGSSTNEIEGLPVPTSGDEPGDGDTSGTSAPPDERPESEVDAPSVFERDGVVLGVAVPEGRAVLVRDLEVETDASFAVIRTFARWNSPFPNDDQQALLDAGRRLHLSVRPVANGQPIPWRDLAEAQPGDPLYGDMVSWAERVIEAGPGTYLTINHEPETNESSANGTADDYRAMWRRFSEVLRAQGGDDVRLVWTMTAGSFSDGRADEWYPGDDVVDVIGADVYNWYTCQGSDRPWVDLEALLVDPLAFAAAHDKPLALPEFGSSEDQNDPERKARWLLDAADTLSRDDLAEQIEFVAWFNVTAPGGTWPNCVWSHDSTAASRDAFGEFARALSD